MFLRKLATKARTVSSLEDTVWLVRQLTRESGFARHFPASPQKAQRNERRTQEQQGAAAIWHGCACQRSPLFEPCVGPVVSRCVMGAVQRVERDEVICTRSGKQGCRNQDEHVRGAASRS